MKNINYGVDEAVDVQVENQHENKKTTMKTTKKTTKKTTEKIYDIIKENPYISTKDISETIGNITADGVRYHINKLKKLGVLERVGADKGGYWKIKS